jgi:ceramide glucosyltransferase
MLTTVIMGFALLGLMSAVTFLSLSFVAALRFRRQGQVPAAVSALPMVTLLKPLHGLEPDLERNLESFFAQDYPSFEIIFATRNALDPALEIVRKLQQRHSQVASQIVFSGVPNRPNAKVCSLERMHTVARSGYFVISDSDVRVAPEYLHEVVSPLLTGKTGLVTCLYRGVPTGGLWTLLEALGMSVEMTSGVIVADLLEGMRFALGPTMAVRRDVLEETGGFGVLADYCADDYVLGQQVHEHGYQVVLSRHVIDHVVINRSVKDSLLHQLRWMKSTRFSRGWGHVGSGLTFATPYGLLGAAAALAARHPHTAIGFLVAGWLPSVLLACISGWGVVRDSRALKFCWLYPVREFLGFCLWCSSFLGHTIAWRGERYRLYPGGRMEPVQRREP